MSNYKIGYQRPAMMLLQLRDELNAVFPRRYTGTDGFPSGYDNPSTPRYAKSGHNANNLGHVMAFDISTPANGNHITEPEGRALAEYLRTKKNDLFAYLIHDMGPAEPMPRIAGNPTWEWRVYAFPGADPHSNHIHLSLTDDYEWGESCGLSQRIYDSKVYWGIKEWYAGYLKPKKEDVDMPTVTEIWSQMVMRGGRKISALQELADAKTLGLDNQAKIKELAGKADAQLLISGKLMELVAALQPKGK